MPSFTVRGLVVDGNWDLNLVPVGEGQRESHLPEQIFLDHEGTIGLTNQRIDRDSLGHQPPRR